MKLFKKKIELKNFNFVCINCKKMLVSAEKPDQCYWCKCDDGRFLLVLK